MNHYNTRVFLQSVALLSFCFAMYFSIQYISSPPLISMTAVESGWLVYNLPSCSECSENWVRNGDVITEVEGTPYEKNAYMAPFAGYDQGDQLTVMVVRDNETFAASMQIPENTNSQQAAKLLIFVFWLPFWLCAAWLAHRAPIEKKAAVMSFTFGTYAVWLSAGLVSSAFVPGASVATHVATWLLVPLSIHLHWIAPYPLRRMDGWRPVVLYGFFGLLVVAELFQAVPRQLFIIGTVLMVASPFVLLSVHRSQAFRNARRMMFMGIITLTIPLLTWLAISFDSTTSGGSSTVSLILIGGVALLALPAYPLLYVYANYRYYFSAVVEQRMWSALIMLVYICIILVAITSALTVAGTALLVDDTAVSLSLITSAVIAVAVAMGTNSAQNWMRKLTYGDFESNIAAAGQALSAQMTELSDPGQLEEFLSTRLHAALGVHVSVLYLAMPELQLRYIAGQPPSPTPPDKLSSNDELLISLGQYRKSGSSAWDWVRLSVPLMIHQELVGVWLLGSRENDDFYAASHIEQLQSLGNQIAAVVEMRRQQREIERQVATIIVKEKEAALGRVVTSVAHQFRNPLQVIMGALEADNDYNRPNKEWLALAYQRAEKLSDVVRSVQRFVSGGEDDAVRIDVLEAIDEAILLISQRLKEQKLTVSSRHLSGPLAVEMGASELTQVILNLLENASDAQQNGELVIETKLQNNYAIIRVIDQGVGIAPEDIEQIYEPLYTTKNGAGLGLWIARSIIERNRGEIVVESVLGKGSVFTIKLPNVV